MIKIIDPLLRKAKVVPVEAIGSLEPARLPNLPSPTTLPLWTLALATPDSTPGCAGALAWSSEQQSPRVFETLLHIALDVADAPATSAVAAADGAGFGLAHRAASLNRAQIVETLAAQAPACLVERAASGWSPLHVAAYHGSAEAAAALLSAATSMTDEEASILVAATGDDCITPLHAAAAQGHVAVVSRLAASSLVDLNAADANGSTPLHLACSGGHVKVARELVNRGASLHVRNARGQEPLDVTPRFIRDKMRSMFGGSTSGHRDAPPSPMQAISPRAKNKHKKKSVEAATVGAAVASRCVATGPGVSSKTLRVGEAFEVVVEIRGASNTPVPLANAGDLQVRIASVPHGRGSRIRDASSDWRVTVDLVKPGDRAHLAVAAIPTTPGRYTVSLLVAGSHISGSPHAVDVASGTGSPSGASPSPLAVSGTTDAAGGSPPDPKDPTTTPGVRKRGSRIMRNTVNRDDTSSPSTSKREVAQPGAAANASDIGSSASLMRDLDEARRLQLIAEQKALRAAGDLARLVSYTLCVVCKAAPRDAACSPCLHFLYCAPCLAARPTCVDCGVTKAAVVQVHREPSQESTFDLLLA